MKIYAFLSVNYPYPPPTREAFRSTVKDQGIKSLFVLDKEVNVYNPVYQWAREDGVEEIVIGYYEDIDYPMLARLERAKTLANRIAIGNIAIGEWEGNTRVAESFQRFADAHDFEWACTLGVTKFVSTLAGNHRSKGEFRDFFTKTQIEIFCLCGYVLLGHEHNVPEFRDTQTMLKGRDIKKEFGFSMERFRDYVSDIRITTGTHWQLGWDLEIAPMAKDAGFKGLLSGVPFKIPEKYTLRNGEIKDIECLTSS